MFVCLFCTSVICVSQKVKVQGMAHETRLKLVSVRLRKRQTVVLKISPPKVNGCRVLIRLSAGELWDREDALHSECSFTRSRSV